jgi:hypothetical protein
MFSRPRLVLLCAVFAAAFSLFVATGSAAAAGTIEGEVVEAGTSTGIEEVVVCAYKLPEYEPEFCGETGAGGEYALSSIPNGEYIVEFWAPYFGYAPQFFNGVSSFEDATEVTVTSGPPVTGVDAELEEGGAIEGRVTDALTGAGIDEAEVCAFSRVIRGSCTVTDPAGDYAIAGLASGSYLVEFWDEFLGYETLFYNQQSNPESANFVSVTAPNGTGGINARLSKPSSKVIAPSPIPALPMAPPALTKPKAKSLKCHKGYKKAKRHGRKVCVKKHKHKKKHHS